MAMETDDERDHSPTRKGWGRWRWLRAIAGVLGGYIALAVLSTGIMFAGVMVSRALGKDPRADDDSLPRIKHLRWADDKLLAGAQPNRNDYAGLADLGVALVVDVRTGSDDDPILDDPEYLASLGIDYLRLPIRDGRAPSESTVHQFVDAVGNANGLVFLHRGGGVGRSTSLQARTRPPMDKTRLCGGISPSAPRLLSKRDSSLRPTPKTRRARTWPFLS
jgi:protein tyrosine phosphatase (PTP) superfamily phosphohydrolase (DUF442 family)